MIYVGILPDGTELRLTQPVQVCISREEEAPADGFSAVFPVKGKIGNITEIHIYDRNGELFYEGLIDEQKMTRAGGNLLSLTGRSRAALLLDNEALPQTCCMLSLPSIFKRHIQPYGFRDFCGSKKVFAGAMTVTKGMSEWQVAEQFCKRYLKVKPRIWNGVFDASGEMPKGAAVFGNDGDIPYSSMILHHCYREMISELLAQSGENACYESIFKNQTALRLGIRRRRCLTANQNAESVIRTVNKKAFKIEICCPGEVPAELLQTAQITENDLELDGELYVAEIKYVLNISGESTRFVLRRR